MPELSAHVRMLKGNITDGYLNNSAITISSISERRSTKRQSKRNASYQNKKTRVNQSFFVEMPMTCFLLWTSTVIDECHHVLHWFFFLTEYYTIMNFLNFLQWNSKASKSRTCKGAKCWWMFNKRLQTNHSVKANKTDAYVKWRDN